MAGGTRTRTQWITLLSTGHVAFHEGSEFAVRALEAAKRQGKYWQALETLLASQPRWAINHVVRTERVLPALGGAGLDPDQLKRDMNDPEVTRASSSRTMPTRVR